MKNVSITLAGFERNKFSGKLAVRFDIMHRDGYLMSQVTSAAVFMSYGAAIKGSRRALRRIAETGKFPNMCEGF